MHEARAGGVREQRVQQRAGLILVRRMNNDAGRFVEGEHVFVFVQDVERAWLGLRRSAELERILREYVDTIAGRNDRRRALGRDIVDTDLPVVDPPLHPRPRQPWHVGQPADDRLIQPQTRVAPVRDEAPSIEHLALIIARWR